MNSLTASMLKEMRKMDNMLHWENLRKVPADALKEIKGGRLNGKSDINPQWRSEAMTKEFGPCGIGWKFEIVNTWTQPAPNNQVMVFVQINLYIKDGDKWSEPIPGFGGDFLVESEKAGLHANDEAYKMATTDALGTAMKMIGVASDVYRGLANDSKYGREKTEQKQQPTSFSQAQQRIAQDKAQERSQQQSGSGIKWDTFWSNTKIFGLNEDQVHLIASEMYQKKVTSLTDVITSQAELNKFTSDLRKHAQKAG
ncbi:hypothetical protein [Sporomusa aerivorans]|uniref:hypothetical protein n=1 Tax=Sporomusa aerivorans TaxID=204936 RepID=UPI00352BBE4F